MDTALNRPLPFPRDRWSLRHGFFWYNDREIFHDSEEDLDHKAEHLAAAGINHVITFSCTHFRWSFRPYWELLTEILARVVRACHRHGIYVTEHHSAILMSHPQSADDWDHLERILRARRSSLESWPLWRAEAAADPEIIAGLPLSALCRKSETGAPARSSHRGMVMCTNNPHYRRAYFAYLETLYATGIDGIMTDDVAGCCFCEHCQRLFREQTGYPSIPTGAAIRSWHNDFGDLSGSRAYDYSDPKVLAWLDFQCRAIDGFHIAVKDHYEGLGLRLLRPNYVRCALSGHMGSYRLQTLPRLDFIFQEAGGWDMLAYSWGRWGLEAAHRFSVGRFRGIPSMTMMYPHREDIYRLAWGLAMSWGGQFTASIEGADTSAFEKPARAFENRHAGLLECPIKIARLGFYDSNRNRELGSRTFLEEHTYRSLRAWMQACAMNNVPYDLFSTEELAERLPLYDVAVLNEIALLGVREIVEFLRFVEEGGTLLWIGATGTQAADGRPRPPAELADLLGLPGFQSLPDGARARTWRRGRGRIVQLAANVGAGEIEPEYHANVFFGDKDNTLRFQALSAADCAARRAALGWLRRLMPNGFDLAAEGLPRGVLATVFLARDRRRLALHLVNAAGLLDKKDGTPIRFDDPVPFPDHSGRPPARLTIRKPGHLMPARTFRSARYHTLTGSVTPRKGIKLEDTGTHATITFDPALLKEYGLIEIS